MENSEIVFAFIVVPMYLAMTYSLAQLPPMRKIKMPAALAVNWGIAALLMGPYAAATGLAGGNWIGVSFFSGSLAAILATAIARKFTPAAR
ncbi:MAG TPA: hypothetical protein VKR38_05980 [Usitatibacter sp.]|nr:hypothetical protein [Usitatibacter sp.]